MYDVPSAVLSFSKTPSTPRLAQGVLARDDVMTPRPVYIHCFTTGMVDFALSVSMRAERVILRDFSFLLDLAVFQYERQKDYLRKRLGNSNTDILCRRHQWDAEFIFHHHQHSQRSTNASSNHGRSNVKIAERKRQHIPWSIVNVVQC